VLTINAGSSSLKAGLFDGDTRLATTEIERIGSGDVPDHAAALDRVLAELSAGGRSFEAVSHRVVHGGARFSTPQLVDRTLLDELRRLIPIDPNHLPQALSLIDRISQRYPDRPQVACFDTAFHRGHSAVADHFAIPAQFYAEGVRRYGFHGLSYEYVAERLREVAPDVAMGRVIIAHLGSGASMCALSKGKSVESTMGFTALDGLPMGTRPGQIDPGVLIYLIMEKGMAAAAVQDMLYRDSGLKGLSGISNDMRELLTSTEPGAKLAVDYFVYRVGLHAGMLAAALGGLDAFVFTAGIGENSPDIRARIAQKLAWLGATLDSAANAAGGPLVSPAESPVALYVVPTDEELMIARHTLSLLTQQAAPAEAVRKTVG
jgi:acetate kinase